MADPRELTWTHAVRTAACVLVVLVHSNIYFRSGPENWWPGGDLAVPLFSLAVPLFFLISGYFAVSRFRLSGDPASISFGSYLRRKSRRLVAPFLFWSAVMLVTGIEPFDGSMTGLLGALLTGPWHLYYMFVLLQFLALSYCVERWMSPSRLDRLLIVAALVTLVCYAVSDLNLWWGGTNQDVFEVQARKTFPFWCVFFVSGIWLRWRPGAAALLGRWLVPLAVTAAFSGVLYLAEFGQEGERFEYHPRMQFLITGLPLQACGALLIAFAAMRMQSHRLTRGLLKFAAASAADTYGIYLSHAAVLMAYFTLWAASGISTIHWAGVPILTVLVWLTCRAAVRLVRRGRLQYAGWLVFGMRLPGRPQPARAAQGV